MACYLEGGSNHSGGTRKHRYIGPTRIRTGEYINVDTVDQVAQYLHIFGVWEPNLQAFLRGRLSDGDTLVDLGANIGAVTIPSASLVGSTGSVVAIEANPVLADELIANRETNDFSQIRVVNKAVSDRRQTLTLHIESGLNRGAASFIDGFEAESSFSVDAAPLGELLSDDEIATTRVVKIDTEGAEADVVSGLIDLIPRMRADVELVVEVNPGLLGARGKTVLDVIEPLAAHGFNVYRLTNDYRPWMYPASVRSQIPPQRWRHSVVDECDLVFSRLDQEELTPIVSRPPIWELPRR